MEECPRNYRPGTYARRQEGTRCSLQVLPCKYFRDPPFFGELGSGSVCVVAVPRQMPRSLQKMLLHLRNYPSEASETCEGGGLCLVRGVKERQGESLQPRY